ncbi:DUF6359 domain-containing protein [Prevotella histicola]|uniref:DUF6359 domain-containing protein n=1 Tax=Prevotella histicola TaxID=470565 RepID=UPI003C753552
MNCEKSVVDDVDHKRHKTEDVDNGESDSVDSSSISHIYTIAEFQHDIPEGKVVTVSGYIVGACSKHIKNAEWEYPFTYDNAILLADDRGETSPEQVIAIQLASKLLKEELGLKSNPDNYGKKIFFRGVKHKYLGVFGIKKNIYDYGWMEE